VAAQLPLDEVSLSLPEKNPDIYVDPSSPRSATTLSRTRFGTAASS